VVATPAGDALTLRYDDRLLHPLLQFAAVPPPAARHAAATTPAGTAGRARARRTTDRPVMDGAVDHVRPDVYAEQADDQDPEPVPQDPERNHEGHQRQPPPRAREEHVGRQLCRGLGGV